MSYKGYRPWYSGAPTSTLQHVYFGTPFYNRRMIRSIRSIQSFSQSEMAEFRLKVIEFHKAYGTKVTKQAFNVSRATIFRWKKKLKESKGLLESLVPQSTRPINTRVMLTDYRVINFIRELRQKHERLGKEKIKPILDKYCLKIGIKSISESTIGKVIKRHNLTYQSTKRIYHNPSSKWAKAKIKYKTKVKHSPKVKELGYIEIDTIVKFIHGIKIYIFNAIDIKLKFQFSYGYTALNSRNALDFFKKLELVYPIRDGTKIVQTDNGLEYLGYFHEYLTKKGIKHLFIYPRCPKINAFIERANRTLQEEFIDNNQEYALDGILEFNRRLIDYLIWYNTERVHKTLGNISPINYLLQILPKKSQMYVTYTNS